jgi:hypothetical protein
MPKSFVGGKRRSKKLGNQTDSGNTTSAAISLLDTENLNRRPLKEMCIARIAFHPPD